MISRMGGLKFRGRPAFFLSLAAGLIIIAINIYGFGLLSHRPGVPKQIPRDRLVRIDAVDLLGPHDIAFALVWKEIGAPADFYVREPAGDIRKITAPLVPYFAGTAFPLIYFLVGLCSFALGILTFVLKSFDPKARIFYWLSLSFGTAVIINGEYYCLHPRQWMTFFPSLLFILSYALVPALLLHFSAAFNPSRRFRRFFIYAPALIIIGAQQTIFLIAFIKPSLTALRFYSSSYPVFIAYLVIFILAAVVYLGLAHRSSQDEEIRSQIKWIFFGLTVGLTPFLFLYQIPIRLGLVPLLSEESASLFFIALPVAVAIAIVRFRLMDVTLVINRSVVYSLLTIFTIGLYLLVVQVAQRLIIRVLPVHSGLFSAVGVFLAAAAFRPAQKRIQDFVDRAFFRQRYDFRRIVYDFSERARHFAAIGKLLDHFLQEVQRALPTDRHGLAIRFKPLPGAIKGEEIILGKGIAADPLFDLSSRRDAEIWARRSSVQLTESIDLTQESLLERSALEMVIALPLSLETGQGCLALGKKKSGERYSREDIGLLRTMASELVVNMERIRLQEEVIYERASKEKLDELNRLKTEFISSVSHELRTPMSSIQGLAEILQAGKIRSKDEKEHYLNLMVSESGRLSRFLHNVLDFGRIERQAKTYQFQEVDLKAIVADATDVFRSGHEERGERLILKLPDHQVNAKVDPDAIKQALINLIDNALKYSESGEPVEIELRDGEDVEILITDRGIGISSEDQERIFDGFYRAESAVHCFPQGTGLGLKIVRHIMNAHGGKICVESEAGAGSTFRLVFPKS
jgi:signal transduction histidine kinase